MDDLKLILASNLIKLRTSKNMTQTDLAEKLNYSDKAVSKWERAESVPDIFVLKQLADIFGVDVDFLITSHDEWKSSEEEKNDGKVYSTITLITLAGIFTLAFLVFTIFWILGNVEWRIFAYTATAALIAWLVLNSIWHKGKRNWIIVSALVFSIIANVYISLLKYNPWQLLMVAIPAELIVSLSFKVVKFRRK